MNAWAVCGVLWLVGAVLFVAGVCRGLAGGKMFDKASAEYAAKERAKWTNSG